MPVVLFVAWAVGLGHEARCTPGTLTSFEHVADDVTSAVITGVGRARFEGRFQPCTEVEAHYRDQEPHDPSGHGRESWQGHPSDVHRPRTQPDPA